MKSYHVRGQPYLRARRRQRYTARVDPMLRERVVRHLAAFDRIEVEPAGHKQAAVALALVDDADGRDCVVLTRRP
ncbi:MAG TPA: hypothetical protein VNM90_05580, partial [Haliangium sp.]|nr:hypothetical protein [Haliangium sp.]